MIVSVMENDDMIRRISAILFLMVLLIAPLSVSSQSFDYTVTVHAPAVRETEDGYVGVISEMSISISEGDGSIFVETWPLSEIDTQASARLAATVASEIAGVDLYQYNFYYSISSISSVIGGPSAGAILTVATVAALNGWEVDPKVMMTGMINPDGTVGPVGGIYEKAEAASEFGIETFLVPEGQSVVTHDDQQIDLTTYAPENWGMSVKEVTDIQDAVFEFTGMLYETEEYSGDIVIDTSFFSEDVNEEIVLTRQLKEDVSSSIQDSAISDSIREDLQAYVDMADERLSAAEGAIEEDMYYTAMSYIFQARISYTYVRYALDYLDSGEDSQVISQLFNDAEAYIKDVNGAVKDQATSIAGYSSLEAFSAAQERSFEALEYLDIAKLRLVWNKEAEALYNLAFSVERARTSDFWLTVSERSSEGESIEIEQLKDDTEIILNDANLTYIYASDLISSSSLLSDASDLLESAFSEFNDENYAAALFNAIESKTRSSVAIELYSAGSDVLESRLGRAKEKAAVAIEEQRANGIIPILSISYYEFASVFEGNGELVNAIIYYKYSEGIANAFKFLMASDDDGQGKNPQEDDDGGLLDDPVMFGIGFVSGLFVALGAFVIYRRKFFKQQSI